MIDNKETDEFLKVIQDNFLKQVILEPTSVSNILDWILTYKKELVTQVKGGGQLDNCDHSEISYNIKWQDNARRWVPHLRD